MVIIQYFLPMLVFGAILSRLLPKNRLYIDPFTIAAGAVGLGKLLFGVSQRRRADRLRPSTYIPPSLLQNISETEALERVTKYPGQELEESRAKKTTQDILGSARQTVRTPGQYLNLVSNIQGRENRQMQDIGQNLLRYREGQRLRKQQFRGMKGGIEYENMRRYWAEKSAMLGAGAQNIYGGLSDIFTAGALGYMDREGTGAGASNLFGNSNYRFWDRLSP